MKLIANIKLNEKNNLLIMLKNIVKYKYEAVTLILLQIAKDYLFDRF